MGHLLDPTGFDKGSEHGSTESQKVKLTSLLAVLFGVIKEPTRAVINMLPVCIWVGGGGVEAGQTVQALNNGDKYG